MVTLRDYYSRMGIETELLMRLNHELTVGTFTGLTKLVHEKRLKSLNQAKGNLWNHGPVMTFDEIDAEVQLHHLDLSKWKRKVTPVYSVGRFKIGAARPGKEAAVDYNKIKHYDHCTCESCKRGERVVGVNNPHDMFPFIEIDNILMSAKRKQLKKDFLYSLK